MELYFIAGTDGSRCLYPGLYSCDSEELSERNVFGGFNKHQTNFVANSLLQVSLAVILGNICHFSFSKNALNVPGTVSAIVRIHQFDALNK